MAVKGKRLVLSPVEKTMPRIEIAEELLWTGDCRPVSASLYVTKHLKGKRKSMTIFKTCAAHFLLFILKQINLRMIPCPPHPNMVLGSTKVAQTAFRNYVLSSKPLDLISFSLAGHLLARDNMVFYCVMASLEACAVFCQQEGNVLPLVCITAADGNISASNQVIFTFLGIIIQSDCKELDFSWVPHTRNRIESLNVTLIKSLHQRRDRFIEHPRVKSWYAFLFCIFSYRYFAEWLSIPHYSWVAKISSQIGKREGKNSFLQGESYSLERTASKAKNEILKIVQMSKLTVFIWWHSRYSHLNSSVCKEITRKKILCGPTDLTFVHGY